MPAAKMRPIGLSVRHRCVAKTLWILAPLIAYGVALPALADDASTEAAAQGPVLMQEVVVTATRREEALSKVPISITALTAADMEARGIKDITDVARFTPGVYIDNSGTDKISIRGISSSGGAGTTGIYIDDTPIQMRALAFSPDETLPKSFDIERVEVLRGPQGTLFGAGSEGGTVRYITTQPSLTKTSVYGTQRGFVHRRRHAELRDGHRRRRSADRRHVRGSRDAVVSRGRRLDRPRGSDGDRPAGAVVDRNANHGQTLLCAGSRAVGAQ